MRRLKLFLALTSMLLISLVYANSLELDLSDTQGNDHKLSDYKGQWVVVNYWATWCPPCVEEISELVSFNDKHKSNNVVVLGVNYEDLALVKVKQFMKEHHINYPVLLAEPDAYSPLGKILGLPTTFIISPEGDVVHTKYGAIDAAYLEKTITQYQYSLGKVVVN